MLDLPTLTDQLSQLAVAFPRYRGDTPLPTLAGVYRDGLHGVSSEGLRWAVKIVMREDKAFPKIARLRELALSWDEKHAPRDTFETDPLWCPNCKSRFKYQTRYRPKINARGRIPVLERRVQMEPVERLLCRCGPASSYPDGDWLLLESLDILDRQRIVLV